MSKSGVQLDGLSSASALMRTALSRTRLPKAWRASSKPSRRTGQRRIRPIFVYNGSRACVFLCILAYYAEWHMKKLLAPILFDEDDSEAAGAQRASPVVPAKPLFSALGPMQGDAKAHSGRDCRTQLLHFACRSLDRRSERFLRRRLRWRPTGHDPTPTQRKVFELIGVDPAKMFPSAGR